MCRDGDDVQLLVDERHQPFERVLLPAAPLLQQPRDVDRVRSHGLAPRRKAKNTRNPTGVRGDMIRRMVFAVVASVLSRSGDDGRGLGVGGARDFAIASSTDSFTVR